MDLVIADAPHPSAPIPVSKVKSEMPTVLRVDPGQVEVSRQYDLLTKRYCYVVRLKDPDSDEASYLSLLRDWLRYGEVLDGSAEAW